MGWIVVFMSFLSVRGSFRNYIGFFRVWSFCIEFF